MSTHQRPAIHALTHLSGKRALVTGASSGIGAATARALSDAGAEVWWMARDAQKLAAASEGAKDARLVSVDVRDARKVAELFQPIAFDIVVNNAGMALGIDRLPEGAPEDWSVVIDTNVKGVLNVMHATLPGMKARASGDHVFVGSVAGRQIYGGGNIYCATKHAVRALYESARLDMAGSGVRFTTVDPGMVRTDFSRVRFRGDVQKAHDVYAGMTPLTPEDVADAIVWALSRPAHVNIGEIVLWPTDQASTSVVTRKV